MALLTYLIDKSDILNVIQAERHKYINNALDTKINEDNKTKNRYSRSQIKKT